MPISNLVECAVNLAEKVTGKDIDGDGDVGVAGNVSAKKQLDDAKEKTNQNAKLRCPSMTVMLPLASHALTMHARTALAVTRPSQRTCKTTAHFSQHTLPTHICDASSGCADVREAA